MTSYKLTIEGPDLERYRAKCDAVRRSICSMSIEDVDPVTKFAITVMPEDELETWAKDIVDGKDDDHWDTEVEVPRIASCAAVYLALRPGPTKERCREMLKILCG